MSYRKLFARLRKEISLLDFNRKKLNEEQKSMLSFIEGKKSIAQFNIDNKVPSKKVWVNHHLNFLKPMINQ